MRDEKKEIGEHTFFDVEREELGRINLTDGVDLVVFRADDHLDMRLWVDRKPYKGLRFYLPEGVYEKLKKLIERVDEQVERKTAVVHQGIACAKKDLVSCKSGS